MLSVLWEREGKKEIREAERKKQRKEEGFNLISILNAIKFWIRNQETTIVYAEHMFLNHIMFPFFSKVMVLRYNSNVTEKELENTHKGKIYFALLYIERCS